MLAMKCSETDLRKNLRQGDVYVENKLDGERLLVHKKGDQIKLYTRQRELILNLVISLTDL